MDENTVAEELYAGSRDDFLPIRAERAKQARAAGDRELAVRVAALRKPTVGAWLVNQVVRRYPEWLVGVDDLAERLRAAHQRGDGEEIRAAGRERQVLLRDLDRLIREIGSDDGIKVGSDAAGQVTTTFQAALIDPAALRAVRTGRLAATVEQNADLMGQLPDIDAPPPMWSRPTVAPKAEPKRKAKAEPDPEPEPPEPAPEPPPPPPPSKELIEATEREAECVAAREQAEQDLTAAQDHSARTRAAADEARARFNATRQAHDNALEAVATARAALATAEREARNAHQTVVALRD